MTAADARTRLQALLAERHEALGAGLGDNALYMDALHDDIDASRVAYVGLAVRSGRDWQALPLVTLRDNAYTAISRLSIDHYGSRASQTVVNGFLDPFLRN